MIQLSVLTGKTAGTLGVARLFPVRIGRARGCDLQLEANGVWDEHLHVKLEPAEGFVIQVRPDALATINSQPLQRAILHNGDMIEIGSIKIQFSLSEAHQTGLRFRETLTWGAIAVISLCQVGLIYWLLK